MHYRFLTPRLRDAIALGLLASVIFFYGSDGRHIRRASEGRVARVAQEMLDRDDWIVPHLNGQPRLQKPPLSSWLVALHATYFGNGTVTVKGALVPPALAAVLLLVLVYGWLSAQRSAGVSSVRSSEVATAKSSRAAGLFAALVLVMMPAMLLQGRCAEMDMLVALCVALAFFAFERAWLDGVRVWWLGFYTALALGFLTKGHVVLVVVLPPLIVWGLWQRLKPQQTAASETPLLRKRQQFSLSALLAQVFGLGLFFTLVLAWGLPFLQQSGMTWEIFKQEGLARFNEETTGHVESWWWYCANVPAWTLPWVLVLPFVVWRGLRAPADELTPRRRLWWCWFGVNLLVWSALAAKQRHYAVPWLTPLALLMGDTVAAALSRSSADVNWAKWTRQALKLIVISLGLGTLGLAIKMWHWPPKEIQGDVTWTVLLLGGMGAFAFAWAYSSLPGRGRGQTLLCLSVGTVCGLAVYAGTYERARDLKESPAAFCEQVRKHVPKGAVVFDVCGIARPQVLFCLGTHVRIFDPLRTRFDAALLGPPGRPPVPGLSPKYEDMYRSLASYDKTRMRYALIGSDFLREMPMEFFEEVFPGDQYNTTIRNGAHLIQAKRSRP